MPAVIRHDDAWWATRTQEGPPPPRRPDLGPCLLWTGARQSDGRYPQISVGGGRTTNGAREAWERANGRPFPAGLEPDHLCLVTLCVRGEHIEAVTHAENLRRAREAGLGAPEVHRAKTTCPDGHPYDYIDPVSGARRCRTCRMGKLKAARARRLAAGGKR